VTDPKPDTKQDETEPPGEGESLEDAAREAVEEIEKKRGTGHAGTGDIG
jgi:hypothetical protein